MNEPLKEYAVGETFDYAPENVKLKVVLGNGQSDNDCANCFLDEFYCGGDGCEENKCSAEFRTAGNNIFYKLVEEK